MALKTATDRQKRTPDNDRDTMKVKAERVLMTDVSTNDIKLINKFTNKSSTVDDVRSLQEHSGLGLSTGPQGITDQEIKNVISGKIIEPTGIHKKKTWKEKLFG